MSYFTHVSAARRYARARPFFHPVVRGRIIDHIGADLPVARALDVACGTGQSTGILRGLARQVIGNDRSSGMLAEAPRWDDVKYVRSSAEDLPFSDKSFDLITVALAFHWFERNAFLREVSRLLGSSGWLIIYDNAFRGQMLGSPAFGPWVRESYLSRYPSPPRDRQPFTDEAARSFELEFQERETYSNEVEFDHQALVSYLMTQSNVIAAIEEGNETLEAVHSWLLGETTPFFDGHKPARFLFGGPISVLRRSPRA